MHLKDGAMAQLSARQYAQAEAFERLVTEFGPFDPSSGADGAHYAPAAANPFAASGLVCSNCVFFEGGNACELVAGAIEPAAICKLWVIPETLIRAAEAEQKASVAVHKSLPITVVERRKDGGRIQITTPSIDRDNDRVFPQGAKIESYLKNPVVLWGHDYGSPWSVVGRTDSLEVTDSGVIASFTFREPATDQDPLHIIRALWDQEFVRMASIGFRPDYERAVPNDFGGYDFLSWELLEWSIVPIGANQDALRLAGAAHPKALDNYATLVKRGRALSAKNEGLIAAARDSLDAVLASLGESDDGKTIAALQAENEQLKARIAALPPASAPDDIDVTPVLAQVRAFRAALTRR